MQSYRSKRRGGREAQPLLASPSSEPAVWDGPGAPSVLSWPWAVAALGLAWAHAWLSHAVVSSHEGTVHSVNGVPPRLCLALAGALSMVVLVTAAVVSCSPQFKGRLYKLDNRSIIYAHRPPDLAIYALGIGSVAYAVGTTLVNSRLYDVVADVPDTTGAQWWRGRQGFFLVLWLAAVPLYAMHRIIRPAWPADSVFTMVELEAHELASDVIDSASLFSVPLVVSQHLPRLGPGTAHTLIRAGWWLSTLWFGMACVRLAILYAVHLSPSSWVWFLLGGGGWQSPPTVDSSSGFPLTHSQRDGARQRLVALRIAVGARLRAIMAVCAVPLDTAALGLRVALIACGVAGVRSETTELLVKNAVAIWRHALALTMLTTPVDDQVRDQLNAMDSDVRASSSSNGAPSRWTYLGQLMACKNSRANAAAALTVCTAAVVFSQVVIIAVLVHLWNYAMLAMAFLGLCSLCGPLIMARAACGSCLHHSRQQAAVMAGAAQTAGDTVTINQSNSKEAEGTTDYRSAKMVPRPEGYYIARGAELSAQRRRLGVQPKYRMYDSVADVDGPEYVTACCGVMFYWLTPMISWPLLFFRAVELPEGGELCSQQWLMNAMRAWALVGMTFTASAAAASKGVDNLTARGFSHAEMEQLLAAVAKQERHGHRVDYVLVARSLQIPGRFEAECRDAHETYMNRMLAENAKARRDAALLDRAIASEMTLDLLSGVSFFSAYAALSAADLRGHVGKAILAFALLEVSLSFLMATVRSAMRAPRDPQKVADIVADPRAMAIVRGLRLGVEVGAAALRVWLLVRFKGALTSVFLAKSLVSVLHSVAGLWRGCCMRGQGE